MTDKELKLIGVILYKCEGTKLRKDKRGKNTYYYAIEMTNADPSVIRLFLLFLRKILKLDESKLRFQLFIHDDLKKEKIESYWRKVTSVPEGQFNKTVLLKQKNKKYIPTLRGTCKIRYHDKKKFLRLQKMMIDIFESF